MKNKDIVAWWERKRKFYNLILLALIVLIVISEYNSSTHNSSVEELIALSIPWMIGANLFYSLGAGLELTYKYYGSSFSAVGKFICLIFGIVFSILWTGLFFTMN